jgi:hypothetical protein
MARQYCLALQVLNIQRMKIVGHSKDRAELLGREFGFEARGGGFDTLQGVLQGITPRAQS